MNKILLYFLVIFILPGTLISQDDPKLTEIWDPAPEIVTPGKTSEAPSDAILLFDGSNLDEWTNEKGGQAGWDLRNGILTIKPGSGSIKTKRSFADCQLHVEWRSPSKIEGEGQGRGNSGIYLQGRYEVQVLDSYNNPTYSNGQAGSIYKQHIPLVNASRKPGEWQTYDIIYAAPRFNIDSTVKKPAYITVLHNGVVVQNHSEIKGATTYVGQPQYIKHAFKFPLMLQEHGNPVSYRNIWIREINITRLFNGTNMKGWYTYLDSLGKDNDPSHNFSIINNLLHIEGKYFGYISTERSYADYYLRVAFKWGVKKYPPRENGKRDCGDYWCVGTTINSPNKYETAWGMKHIFRTENFENPTGEWNVMEIICSGDQSEHYVNGHLVNCGKNASVSNGKILLQSEGAEVYYQSVEIMPY